MRDQEFLKQLSKQPQLRKRFEEILKLSSNEENRYPTADEAEEKAIEEVRKLGKEVLETWGHAREWELRKQHDKSPDFQRDGKKNSIGKAVLVQSR